MKIQEIDCASKEYPAALKDLKDAPKKIYVKGNVEILHGPNIAVIGTRRPTTGYDLACEFGAEFARRGFGIVSGLALGCDAGGHRGCLDAGGKTIAVIAHSFDRSIHPREHTRLAEEILERGGCLVTEYKADVDATFKTLTARNRIQAALSLGVIVVEAPVRSGTMRTARNTLELGRVLGVYEKDGDDFTFGANRLLQAEHGACGLRVSKLHLDMFAQLVRSSAPATV